MIRLPNTPGLNPTAINAPTASRQAAAAPGLALSNTAESIAGVAEEFHKTAVQVQRLENARTVSQKRQDLALQYANLQNDLEKDPEPASRIERTRAFFEQNRGMMEDAELPPAVRHELAQHYDSFASRAMIRQGEDSSRLAIRRATMALDNEFQAAVEGRNPEGVELSIGTALEAGAILPEQADAMRLRAAQMFDFQDVRDLADADPLGLEQDFQAGTIREKYPNLDQQSIDRLRSYTEQKANAYRSDFANDLILSGANPSMEEVMAMEESGQISKADAARWVTKLRSDIGPAHDPFIYEDTFGDIMDYNPANDPSGQGLAILRNRIASLNLPKTDLKVLNDKLTDRTSPTAADGPKGKLESQFNSRIRSMFSRGEFGEYRRLVDDDGERSTPMVEQIVNEDWNQAWSRQQKFAEAWRNELAGMPDNVTFEQVNQAFETLKEKHDTELFPAPNLNLAPVPTGMEFNPDTILPGLIPGPPAMPDGSAGEDGPSASLLPSRAPSSFGGQRIQPAGEFYRGAAATVFGGPNDPEDNGQSAFGGTTGAGGKEGAAIPRTLLDAKFPGRDKKWFSRNVRTVVRGSNGVAHVFPVVDLGTAESVWQRAGRPTLDLTEGAARAAGGRPIYSDNGKLVGLDGLDSLDFAVVSVDIGDEDLGALSWPEAQKAWFRTNKPTSNPQISNSLLALSQVWHAAKAEQAANQ